MPTNNTLPEESLELSKIFHEIKNPLTLINSSLQLIEEEHPEVREFRFWNQTMKDLQNLRQLLNELTDLRKGDLLNITKISLFDFSEDILEATEGYLLETGIPLTLEMGDPDLDFYADSTKLRQAVVNLLKNAAESSEKGSPILLRIHGDGKLLYLSVTDHGCGMDEEQLSKVLEPFHTTKSYGTGLGLPIVKKIIEAHQGTLTIRSVCGEGTTVTLALPLISE